MLGSATTREGFADRLIATLDQIVMAARAHPQLRDVERVARTARDRIRTQPMRVAVVGQIKKGKSTLVNALLAEPLLPTGPFELTYNVNELLYSSRTTLTVRYKDEARETYGTTSERSIDDLERFTARAADHLDELEAIDKLEVGLPNPLLKLFRLMDTPGLNSVYKGDEDNALRVILGRLGRQIQESSETALGEADALVFLFSRALAADSSALLKEVRGPVHREATPMRAVGVLSKCDAYWLDVRDPDADPLKIAQQICDRNLDDRNVSKLFYALVPVSGLLALGAVSLMDADIEALSSLATEDPRVLSRSLRRVSRFRSEDEALGLPASDRARVMDLLGPYGIYLACHCLRDGLGEEGVRERLVEASGVPRLRSLLVSHFGARSLVIRAENIFDAIGAAMRKAHPTDAGAAEEQISSLIKGCRARELTFAQLNVLGEYYRGASDLTKSEADEMLLLTGARGSSARIRLGPGAPTAAAEMEVLARDRAKAWRQRGTNSLAGSAPDEVVTFSRSYEELAQEIKNARIVLGDDVQLDGRAETS